ncbi:MAG: pseudaminic acid synthase [Roseobacter sp.]
MRSTISINGRPICEKQPPYVIAEVSANHNGSIDRALQTIKAAKETGVDAVKIQTYTPDTMTIDTDSKDFVIHDGLWKGRTLYDLYGEAHTPFEWHARMVDYAKQLGLTLFSSPFDETAVDLLERLDVPAFKVASFELVDLPLVKYIAQKKKPMLMSTGMASLEEVGEAIETAKSNGCSEIAIFHCISSYPAPLDQANLSAIRLLQREFDVEVGLSDHTLGNLASVVATSLGATVIEKHFTLSRAEGGVDSTFSLEPKEMKSLVEDTRQAFSAIGEGTFTRSAVEAPNTMFRRSLYFVEDVAAGQVVTSKHIRRIRPGYGMAPKFYDEVLGKKLAKSVKRGDRVTAEALLST